jgi:hypothetical protein
MKKIIIALAILLSAFVPTTSVGAAQEEKKIQIVDLPRMSDRREFQLGAQFIERLAWCETHGDWKNGGNWAGGLGIARSTWINFGGRQFARTPDRATKEQQIIVANRIALWGFTQRSGRFVFPVGLGGWGGLRCALPARLVDRRIADSLAFSQHETDDPYREYR